jgi:tetratricopeptide (TPR) repeat protein
MFKTILRSGLTASTILAAGFAYAHDQTASNTHVGSNTHAQQGTTPHVAAPTGEAEVPLWEGLGSHSYDITTTNPLAQSYFDQGLALAYGFNHWEARRAFLAAQQADPSCAMCFWGEALVLGPNINWPMQPEALEPALAALAEAERLAPQASEREQALISALATRYSADPAAERAALDRAYADAMQKVAARFPDDLDIATLYAEALMDVSPWVYWAEDAVTPKEGLGDLVPTLERVLAANPDHIGAMHLYIHAVEASTRPERAEPYADRLAAMQLSAGHLVHMPSHIYFRLGRYADSLEANKAAVTADETYLAQVETEGVYPGFYYPHNIHFVLVSAHMAGDAATAIDAAEKLAQAIPDEMARAVGATQPLRAAPLFAHAQFSAPEAVLALPEPHDDFPYLQAMWHYARGSAYTAQGNIAAAEAEAEAISAIGGSADFSGVTAWGVPAPDIVELSRHVVLARIAQAKGELATAITEYEAAMEIERTLPYMEPPYWYYPVGQSLGAVLLLAGEAERAEEVFRASLEAAPNNGWACFGLLETLRRNGDTEEAAAMQERLARTWTGDPSLLDLNRM